MLNQTKIRTSATEQKQPQPKLTGLRFGRLIVIRRQGLLTTGKAGWLCQCDCGNKKITTTAHLISLNTQSCGCLPNGRKTHGLSKLPEYRAWSAMKDRCDNSNHRYFQDYGGRGIKVCEHWKSFENFLLDIGERPSPKHSLDRIDVNGDYEPKNCRWTTSLEQTRNRRPFGRIESFSNEQLILELQRRGFMDGSSGRLSDEELIIQCRQRGLSARKWW
jgi:hypothetical protein